ncbi:MAG: ACT domain-containing protein [Desulfobacteraceae bacterium]|nr:MAG: ACT domain-containing protein [Desulfobacteraceae bacterium]
MKKFIISILGEDRPGIIAAVARVLFEQDFNIEDVSQTILQGEFSSIFIATGPDHCDPRRVCDILQSATDELNMHFYVKVMEPRTRKWTSCPCESFVITTRGPDRKGLVAEITAVLAAHNVNVTQLQAVFRGGDEPGRNIMIYEVDIPADTDQGVLSQALKERGRVLNLEVNIQHKNIFEAINRI